MIDESVKIRKKQKRIRNKWPVFLAFQDEMPHSPLNQKLARTPARELLGTNKTPGFIHSIFKTRNFFNFPFTTCLRKLVIRSGHIQPTATAAAAAAAAAATKNIVKKYGIQR